jgi:hypothetical protein
MIRAEQALEEILLVFIDEEEPQEVLRLNAEALIEKFKADTSASYQALANTDDIVANELAKLRDALDREIERRHAKIAEAAYHRAELRHFEPGYDLEDWLAAESDLGLR